MKAEEQTINWFPTMQKRECLNGFRCRVRDKQVIINEGGLAEETEEHVRWKARRNGEIHLRDIETVHAGTSVLTDKHCRPGLSKMSRRLRSYAIEARVCGTPKVGLIMRDLILPGEAAAGTSGHDEEAVESEVGDVGRVDT